MSVPRQTSQDPMEKYVATVSTLHHKLGRVITNQQAVASSLSRAAAALRSMSSAGRQK